MQPNARVIKAVKFEDGTYTISSAPAPFLPVDLASGDTPDAYEHPAVAEMRAEARAAAHDTLAAAHAEADALLNSAREEAEAVMAQAHQEAELLRAQAAQAAQQSGYAEGLASGETAGYDAVVAHYGDHMAALLANTEAAVAERQGWFAHHEKDMVKMAVLIAQKILLTELSISRQSVLSLAQAALKRINDKTQVRLRVHPDDEALVLRAKGPMMLSVDNLTSLEVIADPNVGLGGCVVETRTGIVDARVATQLAEVAATLLEIPAGDASEMDPVVAQCIAALGAPGHAPTATHDGGTWADESDWQQAAPAYVPAAKAPAPVQRREAVVPVAPATAPVQDWHEDVSAFVPTQAQAVVAERLPELPPAEVVTQALGHMTDEEVVALSKALAELAPPMEPQFAPVEDVPTVLGAMDAPEDDAVPPAPPALTARPLDPTRRAADALALRLGQARKGRAVTRLQEEHDMSQLDGALGDAELEAIVRGVARRAVGETDISLSQPLVHVPHDPTDMDAAAEALSERLGLKKKPKRNWYEGVESLSEDGPSDRDREELANALADDRINEIMNVIPNMAAPGQEPADAAPPDLSSATDNLAQMLGKKKKKSNRPWYEGLE